MPPPKNYVDTPGYSYNRVTFYSSLGLLWAMLCTHSLYSLTHRYSLTHSITPFAIDILSGSSIKSEQLSQNPVQVVFIVSS